MVSVSFLLSTLLITAFAQSADPCKDLNAGEVCSFQNPDTQETLTGTCKQDANNMLFCEVVPMGPCAGKVAGDACSFQNPDTQETLTGTCKQDANNMLFCEVVPMGPCAEKVAGDACSFQNPDTQETFTGTCKEDGTQNKLVCMVNGPCYGKIVNDVCSFQNRTGTCQQGATTTTNELVCMPPMPPCDGKVAGEVCIVDAKAGTCQEGANNTLFCKLPPMTCEVGFACTVNNQAGTCEDDPNGGSPVCMPNNPCSGKNIDDTCTIDSQAGTCQGAANNMLFCQALPTVPCTGQVAGDDCSFLNPDTQEIVKGTCKETPTNELVCMPPMGPCAGKVAGDACSFQNPDTQETFTGTCKQDANNMLFCEVVPMGPDVPCTTTQDCMTVARDEHADAGVDFSYFPPCNALVCGQDGCELTVDSPKAGDSCSVTSGRFPNGAVGTCVSSPLPDSPFLYCNASETTYQWKFSGYSDCSATCSPATRAEHFECYQRTVWSDGHVELLLVENRECRTALGLSPVPDVQSCEGLPDCEIACTQSDCPPSLDSCQAFVCVTDKCVRENAPGMDDNVDCTFQISQTVPLKSGTCQRTIDGFLYCAPPLPTCPEDGKDAEKCPWKDDPCVARSCSVGDYSNPALTCTYENICETRYSFSTSAWGACTSDTGADCGPGIQSRNVTCRAAIYAGDRLVAGPSPVSCFEVPQDQVPKPKQPCNLGSCECDTTLLCAQPADLCQSAVCMNGECQVQNASPEGTQCTTRDLTAGTCQLLTGYELNLCVAPQPPKECPLSRDESGERCRRPTDCEDRICEVTTSGALSCSYSNQCDVHYLVVASDWSECPVTCKGDTPQYKSRVLICKREAVYSGDDATHEYRMESEISCADVPASYVPPTKEECTRDLPECVYNQCQQGNVCGPCEECVEGTCKYMCVGCQTCSEVRTDLAAAPEFICTPEVGTAYPQPALNGETSRCEMCECQANGIEVCEHKCTMRIIVEEGEWTPCSQTCGGGAMHRRNTCWREISYPDGTVTKHPVDCLTADTPTYEKMECNTQACPAVECQSDLDCGGCQTCATGRCVSTCKSCERCTDSATCVSDCPQVDTCSSHVCSEVYDDSTIGGTPKYECTIEFSKNKGDSCDSDRPNYQCGCTDADYCFPTTCINTQPLSCNTGPPSDATYILNYNPHTDEVFAHGFGIQYICSSGFKFPTLSKADDKCCDKCSDDQACMSTSSGGCECWTPGAGVYGTTVCQDGVWTALDGCVPYCTGEPLGFTCPTGICNTVPEHDRNLDDCCAKCSSDEACMTTANGGCECWTPEKFAEMKECDGNCPFTSDSANNPCFEPKCYHNGQFDRSNDYCKRAVDKYCGENPNAPGCDSISGLCTVQCGGRCEEVNPCVDPVPTGSQVKVWLKFDFRKGFCDFNADCKTLETTEVCKPADQLWANYPDSTVTTPGFGIGSMVTECLGEFKYNLMDYVYNFSTEVHVVSGDVTCTKSHAYGYAIAKIGDHKRDDGTLVTVADALKGMQAKATSAACLDTFNGIATDFHFMLESDNTHNQDGTMCSSTTAKALGCDELDFKPEARCATVDTCTKVECCVTTPNAAPAMGPASVLTFFLSALMMLVLGF